MTHRKIITRRNGEQAFQEWIQTQQVHFAAPNEELLAAEPDLAPFPEDKKSPELEAAIEVIHNGGLQKLTAIQQQIFQYSVVEGLTVREVARKLSISHPTVVEHLQIIGRKLRHECQKYL